MKRRLPGSSMRSPTDSGRVGTRCESWSGQLTSRTDPSVPDHTRVRCPSAPLRKGSAVVVLPFRAGPAVPRSRYPADRPTAGSLVGARPSGVIAMGDWLDLGVADPPDDPAAADDDRGRQQDPEDPCRSSRRAGRPRPTRCRSAGACPSGGWSPPPPPPPPDAAAERDRRAGGVLDGATAVGGGRRVQGAGAGLAGDELQSVDSSVISAPIDVNVDGHRVDVGDARGRSAGC